MNRARIILASFPEVTQVVSQVGRPDDGNDTTGFFNTEYFVDLKPKEEWRPVFRQDKVELIAALDCELEKLPGALWNFSQPISDNMEEAVSGVKGELAIKVYGNDLKLLDQTGDQIVNQAPYRDTPEAIENVRVLAPTGERVSLAQLCKVQTLDGASEIYREANYRYVAIKYSVRGRDLGGTVEEAIKKVDREVKLPEGYRIDWTGEYASQQRSQKRLEIVLPVTILVIFIILYTMFHSFKWAALMLVNMAMAPLGGLLALYLTHTHMSVSSGVGFLALFGVCVQTGVIMLEYINQLRVRGRSVADAAVEGAVLRLRPIMMTTLVATLGLLPAALSHAIGSDSQRPFAIVIVGGLMVAMMTNIFLLPSLYVRIARDRDVLPDLEPGFEN
jgi:cobalt-zinc-cadmium resistance protein CzcA